MALAKPYNHFLVDVSLPISPDGTETRVFDSDLVIFQLGFATPVMVRGLTLQWDLVLVTTRVLSVSGITPLARPASLFGLGAVVVFTHMLVVGLLPHGYAWVAEPTSPSLSITVVDGLYAVYRALVPATTAGEWRSGSGCAGRGKQKGPGTALTGRPGLH